MSAIYEQSTSVQSTAPGKALEQDKITVTISRLNQEAEGIISLELVSESGEPLPAFEAGAHIDFHIAPGLVRQYSLCNDPSETHRYLCAVLREPESRGGSAAIHREFTEGRRVTIGRPRNNFRLQEQAEHSILLAGGIGVTPLLSMAWRLHSLGASFELHYCTRSLARTAFKQLLEEAPFADSVFVHLDDGPEAQRFDVEKVLASPAPGTHLYACGPAGFMDYVTGNAQKLGWPEERVHVEHFSADVDASGAVFTLRAERSGKTIEVPADKSIAQALSENGIAVEVFCEQGICGTCATPVLEGTPDHRDSYLSKDEKAANDQIMICCSRSKTPHLVLDI